MYIQWSIIWTIKYKLCTTSVWSANLKMSNPSKEDLVFLAQNHCDIIMIAVLSIGITIFLLKSWRRTSTDNADIPGWLGLPFLGETFSFLSATNSTKGCYDFVRLQRIWLVILSSSSPSISTIISHMVSIIPIHMEYNTLSISFFVNHDVLLSQAGCMDLNCSTSETTYWN